MRRAGVRRVRAGEDGNAGGLERRDSRACVVERERLQPAGKLKRRRQPLHFRLGQSRRKMWIGRKRRAARPARFAFEHRERRHDERMMRGHPRREVRRRGRVREKVHEPVRAGLDRSHRIGLCADVDDRHFLAPVGRGHDRRQFFVAQSRPRDSVRGSVVFDDLDVIRSLGDPRVDERPRVAGAGERGDLLAELGPVAAGSRDEHAGRSQVGTRCDSMAGLLRANASRERRIGEHVQFGRHAELHGSLQRIAAGVRMGVDEAGQQGLAGAVNQIGARGRRKVRAQRGDVIAVDDDGDVWKKALAVEHAYVHQRGACASRGGGDACRHRSLRRSIECDARSHDAGAQCAGEPERDACGHAFTRRSCLRRGGSRHRPARGRGS